MTQVMEKEKCSDTEKSKLRVEDIWHEIGGFSWYQVWLLLALMLPQAPYGMIVLSPVFTGSSKVPMFCEDYEKYFNSSGESCDVNCTDTDDRLYQNIVQEWGLVCSRSWIVETITSIQMCGMMTGAFFSSLISDHFGRKKCFLYQTLAMGTFAMLPALATSPWIYAITRFLAGFGGGACFVVYISHLMEFLIPEYRTWVGVINFFTVGEILLALVAYLIRDWRWLTVATGVPAIMILVIFNGIILESPRWLLVHKKTKEAHQVFCQVAEHHKMPPPSLEKIEQLQADVLEESSHEVHGLRAAKLVLSNKTLCIHVLIELFCNMTNSILYYGVSFNLDNLAGSPYLNMLYLGLADSIAMPLVYILNDRVGRINTYRTYIMSGAACMLLLVVLIILDKATPTITTLLVLSSKSCILASWGALSVLIFETAPTKLRSSCGGFIVFFGYFGTIIAPQLSLLAEYNPIIPYLVFCGFTLLSSIASWFLSETASKPLEDTVSKKKSIK